MNKFRDKLFSYLTSKEGFDVEFYISQYKNISTPIIMKRFPQGIFAIIVTNDRYESIDYNEAKYFLEQKGERYSLNTIVFAEDGRYNQTDYVKPKLVVDNFMRVIYCDKGLEYFENIISNKLAKSSTPLLREIESHYITYGLIFINVLIFIICAIKSRNLMDINVYVLLEMGAKYRPIMMFTKEWWRLITCNFLHGGLVHLAFNMYALYYIGKQIEELYGRAKYLIIYILSGLGCSLLSYYLSPMSLSVGASGAIFGLLGALVVYAYNEKGRIQKGAISNLIFVIGINLLFGLSVNNIDNYGHIGGLLMGIISSYIIYSFFIKNKRLI